MDDQPPDPESVQAPLEPVGEPALAPDPTAGTRDFGPARLGAVPALLERTGPWVRFLAVAGFSMVALMMMVGVGAGAIGVATGRVETVMLMVLYPLIALMYFFPSLYLLQYGKRIRRYTQGGFQVADLESALDAQRRFWKAAGVLTIVSVVLSVLVLIVALLIAMMAGSGEV